MAQIEVTRYRALSGDGPRKAVADVRIAGKLTINGVGIVEGRSGLFAAMPQVKGSDDKWRNVVWIDDEGLRKQVEDALLQRHATESGGQRQQASGRPDVGGYPVQGPADVGNRKHRRPFDDDLPI